MSSDYSDFFQNQRGCRSAVPCFECRALRRLTAISAFMSFFVQLRERERGREGGEKAEESIRDRIDSFFCTPAKSVGGEFVRESIPELDFSAKMSLRAPEEPDHFRLLNAIRGGQLDCT